MSVPTFYHFNNLENKALGGSRQAITGHRKPLAFEMTGTQGGGGGRERERAEKILGTIWPDRKPGCGWAPVKNRAELLANEESGPSSPPLTLALGPCGWHEIQAVRGRQADSTKSK
jgi:hypothetical protein